MLLAELHGKLPRELARSEDVLTSNVFGVLEAQPTPELLVRWFRHARTLAGDALLLPALRSAHVQPWPQLPGLEPDLVLGLRTEDGAAIITMVEAKLDSGPSSWPSWSGPITGQLGAQWVALAQLGPELVRTPAADVRRRLLIYLTADWLMPRSTIESMIREVEEKEPRAATAFRASLYWLSWSALTAELRATSPRSILLDRLLALLEGKGLSQLSSPTTPPVARALGWRYESLSRVRTYDFHPPRRFSTFLRYSRSP